MNHPLENPTFKSLSRIAQQQGVRAYVVGGFVRDYFLRRPSKDIDVVVEGSGIDLARALGQELHTNVSVFKNFGTAMLNNGKVELEFVGARRESYRSNSRKPIVEDASLEEDLQRRDFTINALALSLNAADYGTLVDPFNGVQDLQDRRLRTPLDPDITYSDDPLRMMRAVRFATQLDFQIVPESKDAIRRNRERMEGSVVSAERITTELNKIICAAKPSTGFLLLDELELLPIIMPCIAALKGVDSVGNFGHKDNFLHTLQVLDNVAEASPDLWLRWAALLHDVAKPRTKKYEEGHGWTFHGHEFFGAKMVPRIFQDLKLPLNDRMKYVQKLVELHLRPIALAEDVVTDSAVRRLLFDAGNDIDDLMLLCEADITSKNEEKVKRFLQNFALVRQKLRDIEEKDRIRNFQPPISGELIMQTYNLPPSRTVGVIKDAIKDAILDGVIHNSYEEAYDFMREKARELGLGAVNLKI
ncbi:MAG: CCA tRNA nucleotidyltransferase [Prevotellaceae bacterium]|nr:CCA tRNA nucleotidyltransferase [Prevotellaceae bacterium]